MTIFQFTTLLFPTLFVVCFCAYMSFFPCMIEFQNSANVAISTLQFTVGLADTQEMNRVNRMFALICSSGLFFFKVFLLTSMSLALFINFFETIVNEQGYPQDLASKAKWNFSEYMSWVLGIFPDSKGTLSGSKRKTRR